MRLRGNSLVPSAMPPSSPRLRGSIEGIEHYPILGIGIRNFRMYSRVWKDVHMTYLQIAVEGGIPSLILYLLFLGSAFRNLRKASSIRMPFV